MTELHLSSKYTPLIHQLAADMCECILCGLTYNHRGYRKPLSLLKGRMLENQAEQLKHPVCDNPQHDAADSFWGDESILRML